MSNYNLYTPPPQSRVEYYLDKLAGGYVPPKPKSFILGIGVLGRDTLGISNADKASTNGDHVVE